MNNLILGPLTKAEKVGYNHFCNFDFASIKWSPFGQFLSNEKNNCVSIKNNEFQVDWHQDLLKKNMAKKCPNLGLKNQ